MAGSKGELAFELRNLSGIPVTVVDPRPNAAGTIRATVQVGDVPQEPIPAAAKLRRPLHSTLAAPDHLRMFLHRGVFDPARSEARGVWPRSSHALSRARGGRAGGSWTESRHPGTGTGTGSRHPGTGQDGACLDEAYRIPGEPVRHAMMFSGARRRDTDVEDADVQADVDDDVEDADVEDADVDDPDAAAMAPVAMDASATADACERVIRDCSVVVGLHRIRPRTRRLTWRSRSVNPSRWCRAARTAGIPPQAPAPGARSSQGRRRGDARAPRGVPAREGASGDDDRARRVAIRGKNVVVYSLGAGQGELLCARWTGSRLASDG